MLHKTTVLFLLDFNFEVQNDFDETLRVTGKTGGSTCPPSSVKFDPEEDGEPTVSSNGGKGELTVTN